MKRTSRLLLLIAVVILALVVVIRQVGLRPYIESLPLSPTPFPTSESTPDIKTTMGAEAALLSQGVGNALQETANADVGTQITPIATASPTLCPPSDAICAGGMRTTSRSEANLVLPSSTVQVEHRPWVLTATALSDKATATALSENSTATQQSLTATPTLCPWNDGSINCPQGMKTLSPQQNIVMLMASAEGTQLYRYALTATALGPEFTPTPTPTLRVTNTPCGFSWAHQDLPDVAQAAQDALSTISVAPFQVIRADAYGESCGSSFGAMTTDFYLSVEVSDLSDQPYLAQIVKTAYTVLTELKVKLPAAPGYLDVQFSADGSTKHFRAMFSEIKAALDAKKDGESLLAIGGIN